MSHGIILEGTKYIYLCNTNEFKKRSLEDNVYFTLRDIFCNANSFETINTANKFNSELTNNIFFEDRTSNFEYTKLLDNKEYLTKLIRFLKPFSVYWFEFCKQDEQLDMNKYIKFEDWWVQFEELLKLLDEKYINLSK